MGFLERQTHTRLDTHTHAHAHAHAHPQVFYYHIQYLAVHPSCSLKLLRVSWPGTSGQGGSLPCLWHYGKWKQARAAISRSRYCSKKMSMRLTAGDGLSTNQRSASWTLIGWQQTRRMWASYFKHLVNTSFLHCSAKLISDLGRLLVFPHYFIAIIIFECPMTPAPKFPMNFTQTYVSYLVTKIYMHMLYNGCSIQRCFSESNQVRIKEQSFCKMSQDEVSLCSKCMAEGPINWIAHHTCEGDNQLVLDESQSVEGENTGVDNAAKNFFFCLMKRRSRLLK